MPASIVHEAIYTFLWEAMHNTTSHFVPNHMMPTWCPLVVPQPTVIEEIINGMVLPVTDETITKYQKLVDELLLCKVRMKVM